MSTHGGISRQHTAGRISRQQSVRLPKKEVKQNSFLKKCTLSLRFFKLRVLLQGTISGLKSILYISLVLLLVIYLYAVAGVIFFRDNDPWHWSSLAMAITTLCRLASLDDWFDVYYINYYGCAKYDGGFYTTNASMLGDKVGLQLCDSPYKMPWISTMYFFTFIVLSSMVLLSMFIGAIFLTMEDAIEEVHETEAETIRRKLKDHEYLEKHVKSNSQGVTWAGVAKRNHDRFLGSLLCRVMFSKQHPFVQEEENTELRRQYAHLAHRCKGLVENYNFNTFVLLVIVLTGVIVGLSTDQGLQRRPAFRAVEQSWQTFALGVYTIEVTAKIVAKGFKPYHYFVKSSHHLRIDGWNTFDMMVVAAAWVPSPADTAIMIMRMLRLLLVFRVMKHFPKMRIAVDSLLNSMVSIFYAAVLFVLCLCVFGFFAVTLFQRNDPWHFANMHRAMITLFRVATLEDWTDVVYINMFGCDEYGGDVYRLGGMEGGGPAECSDPHPQYIVSLLFFLAFVIIGNGSSIVY
jgi:voltage-gated sodium channel